MRRKKWEEKMKVNNESIESLIEKWKQSGDLIHYHNRQTPTPFSISYIQALIDAEILHRDILSNLKEGMKSLEHIQALVPIEEILVTNNVEVIEQKLLQGFVMVIIDSEVGYCALIKAITSNQRDVASPQIEFSVDGPQEAFVESIDTNINLIRKKLPVPDLKMKEFKVGSLSKTKVVVVYLEEIAQKEDVQTISQRLEDIEFEQVLDSSYIQQMVEDNSKSIFPQLKNSERPDRIVGQLVDGKIVVIVDGSPFALVGPTTLVDFFSSMEDYYLSWQVGTIFRLIRYFAVAFSILATPIYVAVLTFHYELIPQDLLDTLVGSRSNIPFPPLIEAVFLELTIELLREAGARLPTKVGQTLGIVGGIVIGQASVEAGLTSNVLLIIVALAALASFTTPVYRMSNTIRLLRFPFLIFAAVWGLLGIMVCLAFLITHLLRLESLGRPYLEPIFPPRINEWKDAIVRLPYSFFQKEENKKQKDPAKVNVVASKKQRMDIDE